MSKQWPEHAWILKNFEGLDPHPLRFDRPPGMLPNLDWIPTPLPMTPGCLVKLNPNLVRRMK
jgi:hypothetical protein